VAFKKGQQQPLVAVSNACFIIMNKLVGFLGAGRGGGGRIIGFQYHVNQILSEKNKAFCIELTICFCWFFATR